MTDEELMEKYERYKDYAVALQCYECEAEIDLEEIIRIAMIKLQEIK